MQQFVQNQLMVDVPLQDLVFKHVIQRLVLLSLVAELNLEILEDFWLHLLEISSSAGDDYLVDSLSIFGVHFPV